jgi:phosphatidylserine decarboxylase
MNDDSMNAPATLPAEPPRARRSVRDELNFLVTNRIPRQALTLAFGRYSRLRNAWLTRLGIALWRRFGGLDLSDAAETRFGSLHACFTRALRPGARTIDPAPDVMASPCDAIVGACGTVQGTQVFQAKGLPYTIDDLFGTADGAAPWRDGCYVTLRLTAAMYHRFHAPHDGRIEHVTYISGDVWNVNPPAVARIARLYCRNERAVIRTRLARGGHPVALVPVAAILVASIRLHALDTRLHLRYRGPNEIPCDAPFARGAELGWFEHGSTIIVFAPRGFTLAPGIVPGARIRMGQALMRLPADD